jgi:hypothetical protein
LTILVEYRDIGKLQTNLYDSTVWRAAGALCPCRRFAMRKKKKSNYSELKITVVQPGTATARGTGTPLKGSDIQWLPK